MSCAWRFPSYRTGDLGSLDAHGYLFYAGRTKPGLQDLIREVGEAARSPSV